jgi:DNA-binding transcriptional ArsR family regulator
MDPLIAAAAHALAMGDPLGALKRVALRRDATGIALRGLAMAQLGDLARAKLLLRQAIRSFGPDEALARARCIVADAEIALVSRDLGWPQDRLDDARSILDRHGDRVNAAHAAYLKVRRLLLTGKLDEADRLLSSLDPPLFPPASRAAHYLVVAGIALRRLRAATARRALAEARRAADASGIVALIAEVESASSALNGPAARLTERGDERLLLLDDVETLLGSSTLVVDATRYAVRHGSLIIPLANRPVLFAIARVLSEAWPGDASRDLLVNRAFRAKEADESHRARLRVEVARLRAALRKIATVRATKIGFRLEPRGASEVVVLAPTIEEDNAAVLALLVDGESWSSSALATALSISQRTVQRALDALSEMGKVQSFGQGRARYWVSPLVPGFSTTLLLPGPLPSA